MQELEISVITDQWQWEENRWKKKKKAIYRKPGFAERKGQTGRFDKVINFMKHSEEEEVRTSRELESREKRGGCSIGSVLIGRQRAVNKRKTTTTGGGGGGKRRELILLQGEGGEVHQY